MATVQPAQSNGPTSAPPAYTFFYLSRLMDLPVRYEGEARPFGRLYDLGAQTGPAYPEAAAVQVRPARGETQVLPWSAVKALTAREMVVARTAAPAPAVDFWVRRDVLDDQVIDVSGARVLRVNDVHLLYSEGRLVMGHVEVGVRGILRRLGVERPVVALVQWLLDYPLKERFVTWRHVEVLSPGASPGGLRVSAAPSRLADMQPAELADILEELGAKERRGIFNALPLEQAAETLGETEPEFQRTLLDQAEPGKAADILEEMGSTDAADALREMSASDAEKIINRMETGAAEDVKTILSHEEKSAGGIMSTACFESRPDDTAAAVLERVRTQADEVEVFNHIYVLDEARHLIGVLTLRELMRAPAEARLDSLMTRDVVSVTAAASLRDVADAFAKYHFRNLPVVDEQNVFLGAVRLRNVLGDLAPFVRE